MFGHDSTEGIVAVEAGPESVRLYRRVGPAVVTEDHPFRRWILTAEEHAVADAQWTELEGEGLRYLAEFPNRTAYENARYWLRDSHALHIALPSAARQYLIRSGRTLFGKMAFDDLVRMQLDIETMGLDPEKPHNIVFLVSISDNRGFEAQISGDEPHLLKETIACIRERDPDVIEGHNIYDFDLPYLAKRAKRHSVRLKFGRDGSEMSFASHQSCAIGYFSRPFTPVHIHGRHVIDTLLTVQRYDAAKASLSSHSLKSVAQAFGIADDDREIHSRSPDRNRVEEKS